MKTYFDYAERERANMSEEDVRALLDAELMVKGVLRVERPTPRTVPEIPELEKESWYKVGTALFRTAELAQKFIELTPFEEGYESETGYEVRFARPYGINTWLTIGGEPSIEPTKLYHREDVQSKSKILREAKAAKDANEKAEREYQAAAKAMNAVLDGVWADWFQMADLQRQHQKVYQTFADYRKTASDDAKTAAAFLLKVYTKEEITEASDWLGQPNPLDSLVEQAQAEPIEATP